MLVYASVIALLSAVAGCVWLEIVISKETAGPARHHLMGFSTGEWLVLLAFAVAVVLCLIALLVRAFETPKQETVLVRMHQWRVCGLLLLLLPGLLCSCRTPGTLGVKNIEGISELWICKDKAYDKYSKSNVGAPDRNDFVIIRDRRFVQDTFRELAGQDPSKGSALTMENPRLCLFFRDNGSLVAAFHWWAFGIPQRNFEPWYLPGVDEASPAIGQMRYPRFRMMMPDFHWKLLPYLDAEDYAALRLDWSFFARESDKAQVLKRLGKKKERPAD